MKNFANPKTMFKSSAPKATNAAAAGAATAGATTVAPPSAAGSSNSSQMPGEPAATLAPKDEAKPTSTDTTNSEGSGESATVSDTGNKDEDEMTLTKHPLQNTWTMWYLENDRTKSWEDMQNEITSFNFVENFWSLYNHIKPPSEIKLGSDYSLFKKGIRPMWEDAANKQGGRWVITLNKNSKTDLDNLWLDVLLCLIGEGFDHADEICGAVVNIRNKSNKISIWTANGINEEAALEIGHKLRDALRLGRHSLQYQLHKDTMVKQGSNVKSIYSL